MTKIVGARTSKTIVELLTRCGSWPKAAILQASYRDPYVSSPLVARLLIDTMKQVFLQSGATEAALIVETRPPRPNDLRGAWQIGHDWRDASDQKVVIEQLGKQNGIRVSVHPSCPRGDPPEYPHGHRPLIEEPAPAR